MTQRFERAKRGAHVKTAMHRVRWSDIPRDEPGDRREEIVRDDEDRGLFVATLGEVCDLPSGADRRGRGQSTNLDRI